MEGICLVHFMPDRDFLFNLAALFIMVDLMKMEFSSASC